MIQRPNLLPSISEIPLCLLKGALLELPRLQRLQRPLCGLMASLLFAQRLLCQLVALLLSIQLPLQLLTLDGTLPAPHKPAVHLLFLSPCLSHSSIRLYLLGHRLLPHLGHYSRPCGVPLSISRLAVAVRHPVALVLQLRLVLSSRLCHR